MLDWPPYQNLHRAVLECLGWAIVRVDDRGLWGHEDGAPGVYADRVVLARDPVLAPDIWAPELISSVRVEMERRGWEVTAPISGIFNGKEFTTVGIAVHQSGIRTVTGGCCLSSREPDSRRRETIATFEGFVFATNLMNREVPHV